MRNRPDPLLDAVLGPAAASSDAALAAARARRRLRARGRALGGVALAGSVAAWAVLLLRPAPVAVPAPTRPYTLVRSTAAGLERVATRAGGGETVSTADTPGDYEMALDDGRLLALLPGAAGFIGDAAERRLVWFGGPTTP